MNLTENHWTRRRFLKTTAATSGLLLVPSFLHKTVRAGDLTTPPPGTVAAAGYFETFGITHEVVGKVLTRAMSRGGDFADVFFQHSTNRFVGLQDGEVNRAYSQVELGCGVRVVKGDQTGFAFTEDLSPQSLVNAAGVAAAVAAGPARELPEAVHALSLPSYYPVEVPWDEVGLDRKIPLLQKADEVARAADKRVRKVTAYQGDSMTRMLLADSDGHWVEDVQPMTEAHVLVVAQDGDRREENGYSTGLRKGFEFYSLEQMAEVARIAVARTVILFEATPPPAGEMPVVLAPGLSGILLHEAIGHGMEADFNRKGTSVYADRIGSRIAPESVTIVDDGTNPHMRGTINVDDEGLVSQRTVLVEKGILRSYMHDRISARHYKLEPTSNGRRESYRYPPVPRMRNTYMENGPHDPEEIIRSVKRGIYAETFTNGQVNIGSGDFSFYLKNGYLIEEGKLTRPVKDANLIGFGPKVLEETAMVGNDLAFYSGAGYCGKDGQRVPVGFGLPTCKVGGISVGGVS